MIASYYKLKTSERHLIKAKRPQEVIKKIITDRFGLTALSFKIKVET